MKGSGVCTEAVRANYSTGARAGVPLSEDGEAVEQSGSQVEEQVDGPPVAASVPVVEGGLADYLLAGAPAVGEFRCTDCGYGAVIQRLLPVCPMCGGEIWELRSPRGPRFVA